VFAWVLPVWWNAADFAAHVSSSPEGRCVKGTARASGVLFEHCLREWCTHTSAALALLRMWCTCVFAAYAP
jgi:hypothetical protein